MEIGYRLVYPFLLLVTSYHSALYNTVTAEASSALPDFTSLGARMVEFMTSVSKRPQTFTVGLTDITTWATSQNPSNFFLNPSTKEGLTAQSSTNMRSKAAIMEAATDFVLTVTTFWTESNSSIESTRVTTNTSQAAETTLQATQWTPRILSTVVGQAGTDQDTTTETLRNQDTASNTQMTLQTIYLSVAFIGVLGNAASIFVMLSAKELRRGFTNWFITNQCVLDLTASLALLASIPADVEKFTNLNGVAGDLLCKLWLSRIFMWSFFVSSTFNLIVLTIERYCKVVHPVFHRNTFSRKQALLAGLLVWLVGPVYNLSFKLPITKLVEGKCATFQYPNKATGRFFGLLTVSLQYLLPLVLMMYCYARMAYALKRRVKTISAASGICKNGNLHLNPRLQPKSSNSSEQKLSNLTQHETQSQQQRSHQQHQQQEMKKSEQQEQKRRQVPQISSTFSTIPPLQPPGPSHAPVPQATTAQRFRRCTFKTLAIVAGAFLLSWSWNQWYFFFFNLGYSMDFSSAFYHFTVIAVFTNCCLNPFIYALNYR